MSDHCISTFARHRLWAMPGGETWTLVKWSVSMEHICPRKTWSNWSSTNVPGSWGNERLQFQREIWTQPIPIWRSLQYVKSLAHCEILTHRSYCDYNLDFLQTWKLWMQYQFMQYQLPQKPAILTFYKKMFCQGIHCFNGRWGLLSFECPLCPSPWDEYVIHAPY